MTEHETVTVPEDGTYTRKDGTTAELEAGTQLTHEEALDFGLIETEEAGEDEEATAETAAEDEADS